MAIDVKTAIQAPAFASDSSGMLIEWFNGQMNDAEPASDAVGITWRGRSLAFIGSLTRALVFLRDKGHLELNADKFIEYFELTVLERLLWGKEISEKGAKLTINDPLFDRVSDPLKAYVLTLPGYQYDLAGTQTQKTLQMHGFVIMDLRNFFMKLQGSCTDIVP